MKNKIVLKKYFDLIKPKIIFWNLTSVIGGFLLASEHCFDFSLLVSVILGMFMVLSSSCIFNNYIDRNIDIKMNRTKNRLFATELVSYKFIIIFSIIVGIIGFMLLIFLTNFLTFFLSLFGFITYVVVYSKILKSNSVHSVLFGSISGSIPSVVGYCSVSNDFNLCATILFLLFIFWQIPHFYSVAIIYREEYQSASIPIFPVKFGIKITKNYILLYIIGFNILSIILRILGCTKNLYFMITIITNIIWLILSVSGYYIYNNNEVIWAKKMFFYSIFVIFIINMMLSVNFLYKI